MIPGSNLLKQAFSLIAQQTFDYYEFVSRTPNAVGQDVTTYAAPVAVLGSVQPVPRNLFQQNGLDFQRNYVNVYLQQGVIDVDRDVSGDQIVFQSNRYQVMSKTPWFGIDGWDAMLCVQIDT